MCELHCFVPYSALYSERLNMLDSANVFSLKNKNVSIFSLTMSIFFPFLDCYIAFSALYQAASNRFAQSAIFSVTSVRTLDVTNIFNYLILCTLC